MLGRLLGLLSCACQEWWSPLDDFRQRTLACRLRTTCLGQCACACSCQHLLTPVALAPTVGQRRVSLVDDFVLKDLFRAVAQAVDVSAVAPRLRETLVTAVGTVARNGDFATVFALDVGVAHTPIMACSGHDHNLSR